MAARAAFLVALVVARACAVAVWQQQPYRCAACACGFSKLKQLTQHEAGKKHAAAGARAAEAAAAFATSAWGDAAHAAAARAPFDLAAFVAGLPTRSPTGEMVSPSLLVADLGGERRASLFRHLHDELPAATAAAVAAACARSPKHARVKELLESIAVYAIVARRYFFGPGASAPPTRVFDLACGHGFLGHLLAASTRAEVTSVDLERRDAFSIWSDSFGDADLETPAFVEGDLRASRPGPEDLVVAIHACGDANAAAVDLAEGSGAPWLVAPCCLRAATFASKRSARSTMPSLPDDQRYALLCGAFAATFDASLAVAVDARITKRNIVLAGGGGAPPRPGRMPA